MRDTTDDGRAERGMQPGRNVLELILVRLPDLRKSDRRVAEHILSNPQAALGATVAETARQAHVSEPTVMRFCAALGFDGFQDFKLKLAHSLALGMPATQSVLGATDLTNPLILIDVWLAVIWAGCVAVPAHVGLELGRGQGGAVAQTA